MTTPYYEDDSVTLWHGDSLEVLRELPDASVDCCVTSPPYFGLRDYGEEGQYGLEASPAEYVETMRALFAEVHRVLADDGTLWLNLGDSYVSSGAIGRNDAGRNFTGGGGNRLGSGNPGKQGAFAVTHTLPAKNLLGIPWRTAFALQDDGWILRNDIIWAKPNAMPESVTDRLSTKHEHMFMFSKSPRYWFALDPIREAPTDRKVQPSDFTKAAEPWGSGTGLAIHTGTRLPHESGRNPGDVWSIPTQPFSEAHFAVMPQALASRAIQAGCKPDGTVLDPFSGSGTTGLAAAKHGRRYVGIDLSSDYLDLSLRTRLAQSALDFGESA
jgi:DNA modification methylase